MRKALFLLALAVALTACQQPVSVDTPPVNGGPIFEDPIIEEPWQNDERTTLIDAAGYKWLRKPQAARSMARSMLANDPIVAHCTTPGWSYIFYDDQAVIGYEPFPDNVSVMHRAVSLTVELHNRDNPGREWAFINVGIPITPPDTSNDPVLGRWQVALVLDDGTIAELYTAEFDWEWTRWRGGGMNLQLELYNRDNDPDAHLVWGPDTDPPPGEPAE